MWEERLIKEIRKHPAIYNRRHLDFSSKLLRERGWKSVENAMRLPVHQCKNRWKTLRERFMKEYKKVLESGSEASPNVQWKFFDDMSFLSECLGSRAPPTRFGRNGTLPDTHLKDEVDEDTQTDPISISQQNSPMEPNSPREVNSPTELISLTEQTPHGEPPDPNEETSQAEEVVEIKIGSGGVKRKLGSDDRQHFFEVMSKLASVVEKKIETPKEIKGEDSSFCNFLMSIVNKVDDWDRKKLQIDILNMATQRVDEILRN